MKSKQDQSLICEILNEMYKYMITGNRDYDTLVRVNWLATNSF